MRTCRRPPLTAVDKLTFYVTGDVPLDVLFLKKYSGLLQRDRKCFCHMDGAFGWALMTTGRGNARILGRSSLYSKNIAQDGKRYTFKFKSLIDN